MNCLIVSGGLFEKVKFDRKYDLVIACDKGYLYAKKMKLRVDIVMGDFDSMPMPKDAKNIIAVSSVKDDTDTGLAIKYALANNYKNIDIICALGKRIDHTIANISMLKYIVDHDGNGRIIGKDVKLIICKNKKISIKKEKSSYLSVFSLTDKSKIKYIKGTKYDIKNKTLSNSFPLGVSNEFKNEKAEIKVESGILLICIVKKDTN